MKKYIIKNAFMLMSGVGFSLPVFAADTNSTYPTTYPSSSQVTVKVESEVVALAKGYADAFAELPTGAKYVVVKTQASPLYIGSVHSVKALGGVVLIQTDNGLFYGISANAVVNVTNEKPKSEK